MDHDMVSDRISALPDSLLMHILLRLPISDLVRTSVLSKRWEFLWLKVSELDLNGIDFLPYGEALPNLVDRFLSNRGSRLQKFKIKYLHYQKRRETQYGLFQQVKGPCERAMEWVTEVVHCGVQHLDVEKTFAIENLDDENEMAYNIFIEQKVDFMPKYVYVSKTLVSLKLVNVGLEDNKFVVSLPRLKKMHLENICYKSHGLVIIKKLISGSTVLEELIMDFPKDTNLLLNDPILWHYGQIVFTNVPWCLTSTLEFVKINKLTMNEETEIKLVNYFLKNSAVLKKLTLSLTHSSIENQVPESFMKLLTSTRLSRTCQVVID